MSPHVANVDDLKPWSLLEREIGATYSPIEVVNAWNWSRDTTYLLPIKPGGKKALFMLMFDYGLLQLVEAQAAH